MLNAQGDFVSERTLLVLFEAARRLGIAVDMAQLAPTRRRAGGEMLVPTVEYQAVLRRIFSDRRETLGIEMAQAVPVETMGLWGFLLRTSPSFGAMLQRAERYLRLFFRFTRMTISHYDHHAILVCEHPDPSPFGRREQEVCFFLGQWLTLGRTLIGEAVVADEVRMQWKGPADPAPLKRYFECSVRFGCVSDALVFSRKVMDLPLPEQAPELADLFEGYAAAMIDRMGADAGFAERVRAALSEGLLVGAADELAVAKRMTMTRRTLRRRLADLGLSFRQVRQELLRSRAEKMLNDGKIAIADISYLLGYAEPSTFHRAFRNWTGVTPGEWRERQAGSPDVNTRR
jgi:AraC-like DNA-binding protein